MTSAYSTTFYNLVAPFYNLSVDWAYLDGRKMLHGYLQNLPAGNLLEVGCGTGSNLPFIPSHLNTTAIEPSRGMYRRAIRKFPEHNIRNLHLTDIEDAKPFNTIVLSHVVSVLEDPSGLLNELYNHLSESGVVVVMNHFGKKPNWLFRSLLKLISLHPNREPDWEAYNLKVIERKKYGFNKHLSFIVLSK